MNDNIFFLEALCKKDGIGIYGIPASAEDFSESKYRYLRISDISDDGILLDNDKKSISDNSASKYLLHKNDIVFARTGNSTGRTYFYREKDGDLVYAGFLIKYSLDENKVNPQYLRYFTISNYYKQWVQNLSNGSTRGNISAQTFSECPILIPERKQQDDLVNTLSLIDDKIELNNKINSELESMARELYEYRFIQFDFPDVNGKPYKSSGGKMVWNDELKREIPASWKVKELRDVLNKNTKGIIPQNTTYAIDLSIMPCNTMCLGNKNSSDNFTTNLFEMKKFDILFGGIRPYLKKAGFAPCDGVNTGTVHSFSVINEYDYNFALLTTVSESMFNFAIANSKGTKMPVVSDDDLLTYKFPYDEKLSKKFNEIVSFREIIANNIMENHQLSELRDFLLPMLMNGQVAVK